MHVSDNLFPVGGDEPCPTRSPHKVMHPPSFFEVLLRPSTKGLGVALKESLWSDYGCKVATPTRQCVLGSPVWLLASQVIHAYSGLSQEMLDTVVHRMVIIILCAYIFRTEVHTPAL